MLEAYGLEPAAPEAVAIGSVAGALLARLSEGALTADELVRASGVDAGESAAALIELELAGRVMLEDGVYRTALQCRVSHRFTGNGIR